MRQSTGLSFKCKFGEIRMGSNIHFVDNLATFSHDIYQLSSGTESACLSPFSIASAFLMLMAGTGGKSKTQIKSAILRNNWNDNRIYRQYRTLSSKVFGSTDIEVFIATKLYLKNGLTVKGKVSNVATRYFNADIGYADFSKSQQSARDINDYVSRQTNNKVKNLVKPEWLGADTVMVLVNAVYFKGTWETQFDPKSTTKQNFHLSVNKQVQVDMMAMQHYVRHTSNSEGKYSAIALPYKGRAYEMVVVLPTQIDGLSALKKSFTAAKAAEIESGMENKSVVIQLPRFTVTSETDLKTIMPKLGIKDIFVQDVADFSNLLNEIPNVNMFISKAQHKVVIEVNEEGTVAAAGTAIVGTFGSPPSQYFAADHPFLYYIKHKPSNTILFIGHYQA